MNIYQNNGKNRGDGVDKLVANHISVRFEQKAVLKDVTVTLNAGEIISVLGVSGSGKSTLFNVIAGLIEPTEGKVYLNGQDITHQTGHVSYMLQKDMLLPYKTILQNVALPLIIRGTGRKQAYETARNYFGIFGLTGTENAYPNELSGGMRQRAAFLRTYLFSDEVALLDEPFSALDAITKNRLHEWYLDIMQQIKLSTFFITHDIDEAIKLSNRIYILAGQPATIVKELVISEPHPRTREFLLSTEFLAYKKEILSYLDK